MRLGTLLLAFFLLLVAALFDSVAIGVMSFAVFALFAFLVGTDRI
jgi:hypothetical protein